MPALLLPAGATRLTRTVTDPDAGAGKAVAGTVPPASVGSWAAAAGRLGAIAGAGGFVETVAAGGSLDTEVATGIGEAVVVTVLVGVRVTGRVPAPGVGGGVAVTTVVGGAFAGGSLDGLVGGVLFVGGAGGELGGVLTTVGGGVGGEVTTSDVGGGLGGVSVASWMLMAGAGPTVSGTGLSLRPASLMTRAYCTLTGGSVLQSPMWST